MTARSTMWLWQWMDVAEWRWKLWTVRRSRGKAAGLLDALSVMMMDLFMTMTEMRVKRQTMSEGPSFHWLSLNYQEVRMWQEKPKILGFLNQTAWLLTVFNILFLLSLNYSNYLVRLPWVIYLSIFVSSAAHFFYVVAISLSSLGSSEHPSYSCLLWILPFILVLWNPITVGVNTVSSLTHRSPETQTHESIWLSDRKMHCYLDADE